MGVVTVLVVAAMRSEMQAFVAARRGAGHLGPPPAVSTGVLGIGTARARASTERLVREVSASRVLVIGVAGGIGPTTAIGDLVVPEVVLDGASGVARRPAPVPGVRGRGTLHTSDELVVEPAAVAALVERGVVALDMETAAVAEVCERHGIPWSVLRGISDHADAEPVDPAVLGLTGPEGEARPAAVARYVARHPGRIPQLSRLARGLRAATRASADAAVQAIDDLTG
jgi:adenosylhomocysteine nucleosidase